MKFALKKWLLQPENPYRLAFMLSLPLVVVLAVLIVNMIQWEKKSLEEIQITNTREFARAFYGHILSTNIWSQEHGGIYVEITQHQDRRNRKQPVSIMGKDFVKINPAIVTKQIAELLEKRSAYRFHITSLSPTSREGQPDPWEREVLKEFQKGRMEASTVIEVNKKRYFRFMAPLTIDEKCLKCHQMKGYSISDIRGGVSIDIPLETTDRLFAAQVKRSAVRFATFGIFTMLSIIFLTWFLSKRISDAFREKIRQQKVLKELNERLSLLAARDQQILASIVDGIAIINDEGVIESTNAAFTRYTGVSAEEMKGRHISDFSDHPVLQAIFSTSPSGEINLNNRVFTLTEVPVVNDSGDRLLCTLRVLHDATDEKLSAAMELAGATAHEVRQPLSIVIGLSDLVREKIKNGEDITEEIAVFEQQCNRINDIVTRMLNITHYRTRDYTKDTKIFDL